MIPGLQRHFHILNKFFILFILTMVVEVSYGQHFYSPFFQRLDLYQGVAALTMLAGVGAMRFGSQPGQEFIAWFYQGKPQMSGVTTGLCRLRPDLSQDKLTNFLDGAKFNLNGNCRVIQIGQKLFQPPKFLTVGRAQGLLCVGGFFLTFVGFGYGVVLGENQRGKSN
jgi:hypothetical protein